ncbi:hypothetical protein D3C73_1305520 [compost metagenome]
MPALGIPVIGVAMYCCEARWIKSVPDGRGTDGLALNRPNVESWGNALSVVATAPESWWRSRNGTSCTDRATDKDSKANAVAPRRKLILKAP